MTTTILTQHYQALEQSNDEVTRQLAEVQLAKLHYAQPPTLVPNGVQHNRWSHVPLEQLFAEAGNTVHQNDRGYQCGHQPVHSSESGKCIHIKSENGYWYCHSCQQGGDAVAAVKSLQGLSIQDAITYLTQHFGPPHLPQKALPHITSAPELLAKEFPTLQWAVEGLLPEGCSICAARPKN